jgi:uncharacterized protein involved in exopolysaccharide biosynthesis
MFKTHKQNDASIMKEHGIRWLFTRKMILRILLGSLISGGLVYMLTSPWVIQPHYQSEALIYVPLTILVKQIEQQGIGFASDVEIDGHIQILKSTHMRDSLIARFGFDHTMNINAEELGGKSKLYRAISNRIDIEKTRYNSVSVRVRDSDPERAAAVANAIIELGDIIKEDILRANRKEVYLHAKTHFKNKEQSVLELEQRIDSIERYIRPGLDAHLANNELFKLRTFYSLELQELAGRKNHLETIQHGFNTALPSAYVISEGIPEATPVWPQRKLWSLAAVLTFIVLVVGIEVIRRDVG